MLGRTATSATWSAPFSSAIRRRASSSTSRVKPPTRRSGDPARLVLGAALGEQRRDDPVDQLAGRDPLQRGVRRPRRQPGAAARASPRSDPTASTASAGQLLLVAVGERVGELGRGSRRRASALSRTPPLAGPASSSAARGRPLPHQPREVEVEERVEGRPLRLLLHQRRGVRRRGRCSRSSQRQRAQRRDRVEVLGQRDREPGAAQRLEEGDVPVEQAARSSAPGQRSAVELELARPRGRGRRRA